MKKLIALLVTCAVIIGCCTGLTFAADGQSFKIGAITQGTADATSLPLYNSLKQSVEAMGGEYLEVAFEENSGDGVLNAVYNLLSSGVDGIFIANQASMYGVVPAIADLCAENGVYFSIFWTALEEGTDEYAACVDNPFFISTTFEDDEYSGYWAASVLGKLGVQRICTITLPDGFSTTEMRNAGTKRACDEYGMKILGTSSDVTLTTSAAGGATIAEDFMAAYPVLDGIVVLGMSQYALSGIMQALDDAGRDDIQVAAIDFNEYQQEYMASGALDGIIGGHFAGPTYSAILMVNKIMGTPLVEGGVFIQDKFIELDSADAANAYAEKVANGVLYTDEEIQNCLKINNPDFTYEDLLAMVEAYSLDDILTRTQQ